MYYKASTSVFTHLFGTPPDSVGKKKTIPLPQRKKGIFGTPIAAFGCTEEQARGSLHMHSLFWGGLSPSVLQAAGGIPGLVMKISEALNRIVMAHLQPHVHVEHLMRDLHDENVPHAALFKSHHPVQEKKRISAGFSTDCGLEQRSPACSDMLQDQNRETVLSIRSTCATSRRNRMRTNRGCQKRRQEK